jgi:hypothetical protein
LKVKPEQSIRGRAVKFVIPSFAARKMDACPKMEK